MFPITSNTQDNRFARLARRVALGALVLMPLTTAAAFAGENTGFRIALSAPGPSQTLEQASAALREGTVAKATALIEQAQNQLLSDSLADNLPATTSAVSMRDAVTVLDHARQALAGNDGGTAAADVATARSML